MTLRPEFADSRTCRYCGAPAKRLGSYHDQHIAGVSERVWVDKPLRSDKVYAHGSSRFVTSTDPGAESFNISGPSKVVNGQQVPGPPMERWCLVYRWMCNGNEPHPAMPLTIADTLTVASLPSECHVEHEWGRDAA